MQLIRRVLAADRITVGPNGSALRGSAWAIADQGVVSGASFGINLIMARDLSPADYGVVVVAFGGVYLLQAVHRSLIIYPLSLRLASASHEIVPNLALSASVLSAPLSLLLAFIAAAVTMSISRSAATAIAVASIVLASQTYETLRWIMLSRLEHRRALLADIVRNGAAILAVVLLGIRGMLTVDNALVSLTGGAVVGSLWQVWRTSLWRGCADQMRVLAGDAWRIGKWDLIAGGVSNLSVQTLPWTLAAWHGPAATAQLQAVGNLLGATHPVLFGLTNLITPAVAQAASVGANIRKVVLRFALIGWLAIGCFFAVLFLFPETSLQIVYGSDSPYVGMGIVLRWFVLVYVFLYVLTTAQAALNGLGRSRDVSVISFAGLVLQASISLPLAAVYGLLAACAGSCITQVMHSLIALLVLGRATRTRGDPVETTEVPEVQPTT